MPTIRFTEHIQRHVACPAREVDRTTVRDALERYFAGNPRARSDVVASGATIGVVQALSGG